MNVAQVVARRGIEEVLHFTTEDGLLGMLDSRALLPRSMLMKEQRLEYIAKPNCRVRKDPMWIEYNSLSITTVNARFFDFSRGVHGDSVRWAIVSLNAQLLSDDGVVFCTGNNTWPKVQRGAGAVALEAMFGPSVPGTYDKSIFRPSSLPANMPTSDQAEVLYPGPIPLDRVMRVYFENQDRADLFAAQARVLGAPIAQGAAIVAPERLR